MKKLATPIAAIAFIGTPAFAADFGKPTYKAPPPAHPVPFWNWTGFYIGGNAGGAWGNFDPPNYMPLCELISRRVELSSCIRPERASANERRSFLKGATMDFGYGIGGIIVLILDIWALINILQSGASTVEKLLWILLIIVLPLIGFIIWLLAGPGGRRVRL